MKLFKHCQKMIRPIDILLMIIVLFASFVPVVVFAWIQTQMPEAPPGTTTYALISIDGIEIDRLALYDGAQMMITYTKEDGLVGQQFNIVEIDGKRVRVKRDNSPDQIGVSMGWASRPGQVIIVLPHRFLIHIIEEHPFEHEDEIIIPF